MSLPRVPSIYQGWMDHAGSGHRGRGLGDYIDQEAIRGDNDARIGGAKMQAEDVIPSSWTCAIPMAAKTILVGFLGWAATHGYGFITFAPLSVPNEEQLEALIDDFINQGVQASDI